MSPIANESEEAVALRVFVAVVAGIVVAGVAVGWLFGLAGIGVLAMIATALMLLLTVWYARLTARLSRSGRLTLALRKAALKARGHRL